MSTALTGPASGLGHNMQTGVLAALNEVNNRGGVGGREICLVTLDDGYEPARTAPNIISLIEHHKALALIGNVGTPTAVVTIPFANRYKIPFFGAYSGAGILRKNPPDRYVINYRASYAEETAAMVKALITKVGLAPEDIAFFTQRDAYGDAGYFGGIAALKQYGLKNENRIAHGRYERNTLAVGNALADLLMAETLPRAVIMVGAYAPCAEFIRFARKVGFNPYFLNVSFVGTEGLIKALGDNAEGVLITQVVPDVESDLPIVKDFRKALRSWKREEPPTFGALEGYISTRIFLRALGNIAEAPDREAVVDALENLGKFDVGLGEPLFLSKADHQASHTVWATIIRKGRAVPLDWGKITDKQ
ncbi:MAG: ABC transporter substrate-binding protein [Proteobacteria bacterium]|nr:ABC transporter substrate-binding protein [Pseudomonadota bacterium]MBU1708779.1 ABC transporter substrate-binding protein [Pseudomonadota bacterium]